MRRDRIVISAARRRRHNVQRVSLPRDLDTSRDSAIGRATAS
jgi:hypothetical protein